MIQKQKKCRKCKDSYYNKNDCDSIRNTTYCIFCVKEIKWKKDLVALEKKRAKTLALNKINVV